MSGAAAFTGAARLAGVAGAPVAHSLSPLIHNSWIAAAGLDAVYVPFAPGPDGFARLVRGLSGGAAAGLNVTAPFKAEALALADAASPAARAAGAANLLVFGEGGAVRADNTDGAGLLAALGEQAPAWRAEAGAAVVLGAGGAAAGAAAALLAAGAPQVRLVARNPVRGRAAAEGSDERLVVHAWSDLPRVLEDAALLVNATPLGLGGAAGPVVPWDRASRNLVVIDMVYAPLRTPLLRAAAAHGLATVDGLAMLVGQARPSFEALFGRPPPPGPDVRALCLRALGEGGSAP